MFYFFNSASRTRYKINILNTLYLPTQSINTYKYSKDNLPVNAYEKYSKFINDEVLILYVDRSTYKYYPLRFGKLLDCEMKGNDIYFKVQLDDYIYPDDINVYNERIKLVLEHLNPPVANKERCFYAIYDLEYIEIRHNHQTNDNIRMWEQCVKDISKTDAFHNPDNDSYPIFIRANFYNDKGKVIKPKIKKYYSLIKRLKNLNYFILERVRNFLRLAQKIKKISDVFKYVIIPPIANRIFSFYKFKKNKEYELELTYYFHRQEEESSFISVIDINNFNNIYPISHNQFKIAAKTDSFSYRFYPDKQTDYNSGIFTLTNKENKIYCADVPINYSLKSTLTNNILLFVSILLISLTSFIIGIQKNDLSTEGLYGFVKDNFSNIKILAHIVQILVLFAVFKLAGKKFI